VGQIEPVIKRIADVGLKVHLQLLAKLYRFIPW
jgi:hypothetical protein